MMKVRACVDGPTTCSALLCSANQACAPVGTPRAHGLSLSKYWLYWKKAAMIARVLVRGSLTNERRDRMWRAVFPLLKSNTRARGGDLWAINPLHPPLLSAWPARAQTPRQAFYCVCRSRKTISPDIIDVTDVPVIKLLACEGPRCQRAREELRERSLRACLLHSGGDPRVFLFFFSTFLSADNTTLLSHEPLRLQGEQLKENWCRNVYLDPKMRRKRLSSWDVKADRTSSSEPPASTVVQNLLKTKSSTSWDYYFFIF